jgi:hypothetical protein
MKIAIVALSFFYIIAHGEETRKLSKKGKKSSNKARVSLWVFV